jgi:hypothetical protein
MTSTDLFQQRANACRRLATAARKGSDRAFWLGLVERWQTLESQSARRYRLRQTPQAGDLQSIAPAGEAKAAEASQTSLERRSRSLRRRPNRKGPIC